MKFDDYKFHCSSLGYLMTNPRSKKETLSVTTKNYLLDVYIERVYKRTKDIQNRFMEKGLYAEEDSINLASKHYKKLLIKNKKFLKNDYICGIPDVHLGDTAVLDVKTSWDIWSFMRSDGKDKNYYWQLQGYMALTGRKKADLAYCLVDTPEHIVVSEKNRLAWRLGIMDASKEMAELEDEVDNNLHYSKDMSKYPIPEGKRIKIFSFDFDPEGYEKLKVRIVEARKYLNSLDL